MSQLVQLYNTPTGPKFSASYSSMDTFEFCQRKFYLTRIEGWREKAERSAPNYGKVVESAVAHHVRNGFSGGVEKFIQLWEEQKKSPEFPKWVYAKADKSWENLMHCGQDHLKLFAIKAHKLPIFDKRFPAPRFQQKLVKTLFPGSPKYGHLTNVAYLDLLSHVDNQHPMLVPLAKPEFLYRTLITDIKTSAKEFTPELVALDPQLVSYAWMKRLLDIAFLNFVKKGRSLKAENRVTLLIDAPPYPAGYDVTIIGIDPAGVWVGAEQAFQAYETATKDSLNKRLAGNALKAAKAGYFKSGVATLVPFNAVTKQKMQFISARLDEVDVDEYGKLVGQITVAMMMAAQNDFYPKQGGLRFPNDKCKMCSMKYICTKNSAGRDEHLTRAGEEWLEEEYIEDAEVDE